jgi:hypothetical protein
MEAERAMQSEEIPARREIVEPTAFIFDGWSMVPLDTTPPKPLPAEPEAQAVTAQD